MYLYYMKGTLRVDVRCIIMISPHTVSSSRAWMLVSRSAPAQPSPAQPSPAQPCTAPSHASWPAGVTPLEMMNNISNKMLKYVNLFSYLAKKSLSRAHRWYLYNAAAGVRARASNEPSRSSKLYNYEEDASPGWKWLLPLSHLRIYEMKTVFEIGINP